MNSLIETTITKLERLQHIAKLLQTELAETLDAIKNNNEDLTKIQLAKSVPYSLLSSDGIELEDIIKEADLVTHAENIDYVAKKDILLSSFIGHKSLFTKYLSPLVINIGKGFIKPIDLFPQYGEDIITASANRLFSDTWPSGFYRNEANLDRQLLIKMPGMVLRLDNLPSNTGKINILVKEEDGVSFTQYATITDLNNEQLTNLQINLELALKNIIKLFDF